MAEQGFFKKHLHDPVYLRMLGYTVTFVLHLVNSLYVLNNLKIAAMADPDAAYFAKYADRLLTIWNVVAQIIYSGLGLSCEVLASINGNKIKTLLKTLKKIRDSLFAIFIIPVSLTIATVFWVIYAYEPTFILPIGVLKVFPLIPNNIMHTYILLFVFWEIACRHRNTPKSHLLNLVGVYLIGAIYIAVLFVTQSEANKFPYPVLNKLNGTPYLYGLFGCSFAILHFGYNMQWKITDYFWPKPNHVKKIK